MLPKNVQMMWTILIFRVGLFLVMLYKRCGHVIETRNTQTPLEEIATDRHTTGVDPKFITLLALRELFICFDSDAKPLILDWNRNLGKSLNSLGGFISCRIEGVIIRGPQRTS